MKTSLQPLIILLGIFICVNTQAAGTLALIDGKFNAESRQERIEIAKDILQQIGVFYSYVPNPSPSELSWINRERSEIDKLGKTFDIWIERTKRFYESPEFQQQKIKGLLNNIKTNLECIINDNIKLKSEILCWAVVSHNLSDRATLDDSIMILKRHDRLPKDIELKTNSNLYAAYALGIQEYIVIPYLGDKLK